MIWLVLTIVLDAVATSTSRLSRGFSIPLWAAATVLAYVGVLVAFSRAISTLPVGTSYATWSGIGTVAVATIGCVAFGDQLRPTTVLGTALVALGVVVLNAEGVRAA